jgi:REP element-mobilizing transposase RayT
VGGHRDHDHILCSLPRDETLIKVIRIIKSYSSKWMKTKGSKYHKFYWQSGYGAFSINPDQIDVVRNYIAKQDEHHKTRSFKDEYRLFLKKYNFDYDERYLWD